MITDINAHARALSEQYNIPLSEVLKLLNYILQLVNDMD